MATQIKSKLSSVPPNNANNGGDKKHLQQNGHQQSNDSVDLDNLFAFLSEVTPSPSNNNVIEDISDNLDSLVQDLDVELENVIQQEIDGLTIHDKPTGKPVPTIIGVPTLPEPTMPPPPPPVTMCNLNGNNNGIERSPAVLSELPPPMATKQVKPPTKRAPSGDDEPIYEAVIPRDDAPMMHDIAEIPAHHGAMDQKLRYVKVSSNQFLFLNNIVFNARTSSDPKAQQCRPFARLVRLFREDCRCTNPTEEFRSDQPSS